MTVLFQRCSLFDETFEKFKRDQKIVDAFKEFSKAKATNPSQLYGSRDYKFSSDGFLHGFWHAHLTYSVSIIYTVERKGDNYTFKLYGLFTHDDSGTGQPANKKKQKALASRLSHQSF